MSEGFGASVDFDNKDASLDITLVLDAPSTRPTRLSDPARLARLLCPDFRDE